MWAKVEEILKERFGKVPDMEGVLYLIGINELGKIPREGKKFSKEQKQDLMHIGVCKALEQLGYYKLELYDEDGWPHYQAVKPVEATDLKSQEDLLKEGIAKYLGVL